MGKIIFKNLTKEVFDNLKTKTMVKATNKKTLAAVASRVLEPIAMRRVIVDPKIKGQAIRLLGEINERLDDPNLPAELPLTPVDDVWASPSQDKHKSEPSSLASRLDGRQPSQAAWEQILGAFNKGACQDVVRYLNKMLEAPELFPPFPVALENKNVDGSLAGSYSLLVKYFSENQAEVPAGVLKFLGIKPPADDSLPTRRIAVDSQPTAVETKVVLAWREIFADFNAGHQEKAIDHLKVLTEPGLFYSPPFTVAFAREDSGLTDQDLTNYKAVANYCKNNLAKVPANIQEFLGIMPLANDSLPPLPPLSTSQLPAGPNTLHDVVGDNFTPSMVVSLNVSVPSSIPTASHAPSKDGDYSYTDFLASEPTVVPVRPAEPSAVTSLAKQLKAQSGQVKTVLDATLITAETELAGLQASLEATQTDLQKFNDDIRELIESLESERARTREENQCSSPEKAGAALQITAENSYKKNKSVPPGLADSLLPNFAADPRLIALNRRGERWSRTIADIAREIEAAKNDSAAWQTSRQEKIDLLSEAIRNKQILIENLSNTIKALLA